LRQLSGGRLAQPVRGARAVRQPDLRLRHHRGARHLLAADRALAAVRAVRAPTTMAEHQTEVQVPKSEHDGGFPPFKSQTFASQLVWLVIAFVLLYVLMAKLALPRVGGVIESRQKRIADDVAEAGRLKQQSDEAVAAYEKALAATKEAAMSNVRAIAEDAAAAIVERLIGAAPNQKTVAAAVTDVLKR